MGKPTISAKQFLEELSSSDPTEISVVDERVGKQIIMTPAEFLSLSGAVEGIGADGTISLRDSSGKSKDVNSDAFLTNLISIVSNTGAGHTVDRYYNRAFFGIAPTGAISAEAQAAQFKFGAVRVTLVGGTLANVELVPALAGFHSGIQICAIWSPTADVYNLILQDEDDAGLIPDLDAGVNVEIKGNNEISPYAVTHGAAGDNSGSPPDNPSFRTQAVNKAIEVDVVGAGVQVIVIFFCFWFEDLS